MEGGEIVFGTKYYEFMSNDMRFDVYSIESKLNEPFFENYKSSAVDFINKCIDEIMTFEASGIERNLYSNSDNIAVKAIRLHYCKLADSINNEDVTQVFDALRHSFSCYAYNGLYQLYTRQENECWHPRIILNARLEPNDIALLAPIIKIYRGCGIHEFDNGSYGQAWTTSVDIAKDFAFKHYQDQPWFKKQNRVVVETIYSRDDLLFSHQSIEHEVVVDINKLEVVKKHI